MKKKNLIFLTITLVLYIVIKAPLYNIKPLKVTSLEADGLPILSNNYPYTYEWDVFWGNSRCSGIAIDSNNNLYQVGYKYSSTNGWDIILVKYDESGNYLWQQKWGGPDADTAKDIAIDSSDNIYIVGTTRSFGAGQYDACIVKYDSNGVQLWNRTWGGINNEGYSAIVLDSSDNIYLAANTKNNSTLDSDLALVKYDNTGSELWNQTCGSIYYDNPRSVTLDHLNNIYIGGIYWDTEFTTDLILAKFSNSGILEWNYTWDRSSEIINDLKCDTFGNLYAVGSITEDNDDDFLIIKFDSSGAEQWNKTWGGSFTDDSFDALLVDNSNLLYIAGESDHDLCVYILDEYGSQLNDFSWGDVTNYYYCEGIAMDPVHNIYLGSKKDNNIGMVKFTSSIIFEIKSPSYNDLLGNLPPTFELYVNEINLDSAWYSLNNNQNYSFIGNIGTFNHTAWNMCANGTVDIRFYANNSLGEIQINQVTVRKDILLPEFILNSPLPNQLFNSTAPMYKITIIGPDIDATWYTLAGGKRHVFNSTMGEISQNSWNSLNDGSIKINFCSNNSFGTVFSYSIEIEKYTTIHDARNAYAIIVGISDYPGDEYDLSYCDDDAQEIYSMLINDFYFDPDNIIYLQDASGTKNSIDSAFNQIASKISEDDILFFYFSGHGSGSKEGPFSWTAQSFHPYQNNYDMWWSKSHSGAAYMRVHFERFESEYGYDYALLGNSLVHHGMYYQMLTGNLGTNFWSGFIPTSDFYIRFLSDGSNTDWGFKVDKYEAIMDDGTHYLCSYDSIPNTPSNNYLDTLLNEKLGALNCGDKFVILDSCQSGGMIPEIQDIGTYIMTACDSNQFSREDPTLQNGIFTHYLLNSFENSTDINGDGVVSLEEMYDYSYSNTVSYSESLGGVFHPQESDGIQGESVIYPSIGSVNLNVTDNYLDYSFFIYGHGLIKTINLSVCSISNGAYEITKDLKRDPATKTGFGYYSGIIQLNETITGYELLVDIYATETLSFNFIYGDSDGDGLYDVTEIRDIHTNPMMNDTDSDGLSDYEEYFGVTNPINNDTDDDGLLDGLEVNIYYTNPLLNDTDSDGLLDGEEVNQFGTDPLDSDTDSDGLLDGEEVNTYNTDPLQEDSDSDNLSDGDEIIIHFTNPLNNDTDSDNLSDGNEVNIYKTNPLNNDTDSDNLSDSEEVFTYNTNPLIDDTDSDGLLDGEEVNTYGTNPLNADSDSDGLSDYDELITYNTDPLNYDTDSDTMPDGWEIDNSLDPFTNDTTLDPDNDLLTNIEEFQHGTLAMNNDTDSDGLLDGEEVFTYNTNPTIGDTDSDGLLDGEEVNFHNTNPLDDDTDSDGLLDGAEVNVHNTDPLSGDTDSDTMPDKWEVDCSLNPLVNDTMLDPDNDDLTNILEYQYNTNPQDPDTDRDGWTDGDEVLVYGTDPLDPNDHPNPPTPPPAAIPGYHIIILISIVGWISLILIRKKKIEFI